MMEKQVIKPFYFNDEKSPNRDYTTQLMQINNNVCQGNALMQNYANYIDARLDEAMQKKKKKCISHMIATANDGEIKLVYVYDDNTATDKTLILNHFGNWKIFRLVFEKTEQEKDYFVIFLGSREKPIFGEVKKCTAEGLNSYFTCAEVKFNADVTEGIRKKALFETFGAQILNCIYEYKIPELAGWNGNDFVDAHNYYFRKVPNLPKLPVMKKKFHFVHNPMGAKKYIESTLEIRQYRHRIIALLIPLIGILSSFYVVEEIKKNAFNFVCLNKKISLFLPKLF